MPLLQEREEGVHPCGRAVGIQHSTDRKEADLGWMEVVRNLRIQNDLGLHARCAARIVALAGQFRSKLYFKKDEHEVEGSSILSLLTLACPKGTEVQLRAVGEDADSLMEAMTHLFEQRFGE